MFAILEYDKQYLLLDTMNNGTYIINIEMQQKAAVYNLRIIQKIGGKIYILRKRDEKVKKDIFRTLYRRMIKLKDGQVLTVDNDSFGITDINEQKKVIPPPQDNIFANAKFVISGNYIIVIQPVGTKLFAYKFKDD